MKILYISTISNTVNAFLIPHIRMLFSEGHHVDLAFNIVEDVNPELIKLGCKVHHLEFNRSPLKKQNYYAYKKLKKIIETGEYDLIHTHTPVASAFVRIACRKERNVKVIYTAHGFHFFHGAPFRNWLIYYLIERWLAKHTDILITINKEDYLRAKSSLKARRIEYVPGIGINTKKFKDIFIDKLKKREELGIPDNAFVLLSVGELNKNKNHETIIKAISKLNNSNIYYLICGEGILREYLENLIQKHELTENVKMLGFRKDVSEIYKIANVFVFPSYREGLPVSLMEAMASGIPIICSKIRGNIDLIEDRIGGYLVEPNSIEGFREAIENLMNDPLICNHFINENYKKLRIFESDNVIDKMKRIYDHVLNNTGGRI